MNIPKTTVILFAGIFLAHFSCTPKTNRTPSAPKVIYDTDNRQLVGEISQPSANDLHAIQATVSLWTGSALTVNADGDFTFDAKKFGEAQHLCEEEPFWEQPIGPWCSGFLVAPDIIATAGHCITDQEKCATTKLVFGFHEAEGGNTSILKKENVYSCVSILSREQNHVDKNDYALVKLDRPVEGRTPFQLSSDQPAVGDELILYGHPSGLPQIKTDGAMVRSIDDPVFIVANSDSYGGNSGSPVTDQNGRVAGILVRGDTDFIGDSERGCYLSNKVGRDEGMGESITRVGSIKKYVDVNSPRYLLTPYRSKDFGYVEAYSRVTFIWNKAPRKASLLFSSSDEFNELAGKLVVAAYDVETGKVIEVEKKISGEWAVSNKDLKNLVITVRNEGSKPLPLTIDYGKSDQFIDAGDLTKDAFNSGSIWLGRGIRTKVLFTLSEDVDLKMTTHSSLDTFLELYKKEGTTYQKVASNDDDGEESNGLLKERLGKGSYYLLVKGYSVAEFGQIDIALEHFDPVAGVDPVPQTPGFSVEELQLARTSSKIYQGIVKVTNTGEETKCFIRAEYKFNTSSGQQVSESSYLSSTQVYQLPDGTAGDTCLKPRDEGYLTLIFSSSEDIVSYTLSSFSAMPESVEEPPSEIELRGFELTGSSPKTAEIRLSNVGRATLEGSGRIAFFADDGSFLSWDFVPEHTIKPGEMITLSLPFTKNLDSNGQAVFLPSYRVTKASSQASSLSEQSKVEAKRKEQIKRLERR